MSLRNESQGTFEAVNHKVVNLKLLFPSRIAIFVVTPPHIQRSAVTLGMPVQHSLVNYYGLMYEMVRQDAQSHMSSLIPTAFLRVLTR